MNYFKGKQFQKDVIIVAVGYYLRYNLSYREIQELLYDRGINVCDTTIYRWVQEYSKVLYHLWKKKNRQSFYSWKMDETYIKIKGRWSCSIKLLRYFTVRCSVLVYKPTLCNFLKAEPREGALPVTIAFGSPNCLWSRFKNA